MPMKRQRGGDTPSHDPGTEHPALVWSSSTLPLPINAAGPDEARERNTHAVSHVSNQMQQAQSSPHLAVPLVKRQQLASAPDSPEAATGALPMPGLAAGQGGSDLDQQMEVSSSAAMCLEDLLQPGDAYVQPVHSSEKGPQQQQQQQQQQGLQQPAPHWVAATSQPQQPSLADDGVWGSDEEVEEEGGTWQQPHMQLPVAPSWGHPATLAVAPETMAGAGSAGQGMQGASSASSGFGHMQSSSSLLLHHLPLGGSVVPGTAHVAAGGAVASSSRSRGTEAGVVAAGWMPWDYQVQQQAAAAAAAGRVPGAGMAYGASSAAQPLLMGRSNPHQQPQQQQPPQQQPRHWRGLAGWQLPPGTLRLPFQQHQQRPQPQPLPVAQQPAAAPPQQQPQQQVPWRSRRGNARQRRQRDRAAGQQQVAVAASVSPVTAAAGVTWSPAAPQAPGSAPGAAGAAPQAAGGVAAAAGRGSGGLVNLGAIFGSPAGHQAGDAGDAGVRRGPPGAAGQQIQQLLAGIAALQQAPGGRAQQGRRARRELAFSVSGAGQQVQAREAESEQDV